MDIKALLQEARSIWGSEKLSLSQILVRMGVTFGSLCRWERDADKDREKHTPEELKKQMGNMLFSMIRWCDDLGLDPEECLQKAMDSQRGFAAENQKR